MKGIYKFGIVALLLFTITSASAITQIGDNITVPNNVTAQNFLGNLNWVYLLGIPTDFPNSTVAGYNGNFPNTSVTNIQGVNTAQNTSISNLQSNDTVHDSKISTIQSNETGYAKLDGTRTVTGSWNWGGFNLTNALRVVASFFEGDGSRLSNLNASNLTGTFNASTDTRTNFPNTTLVNTASNVGTAGFGLFKQKTGVNLEFLNISNTSKIFVNNTPASNSVQIDVNESALTLNNIGGTLSISKGGTGQTTQAAAFDALDPMTTKGDLIVYSTTATRLPVGANNQTLIANSSATQGVSWQTPTVIVDSLSADDIVSTIALAKTTGLDQPVTPGTYVFKYYIIYNSSVATTGIRLSASYSGTQTAFVWITRWVDLVGTATAAAADQDSILAAGTVVGAFASRAPFTTTRGTTISVDTANADMLMIIEGVAVVTGNGNFELWHGSETAAATTVKTGSSLILTKTG